MAPDSLHFHSVKNDVSPEEWQQRVDLAACYRLIALYGWDDLIFTHISARVPDSEHDFLINPYGLMFEEITASSLIKVDLDGNKLTKSDHPVNVAGFVIHSAVHRARADAQCVIHLHTDDGVAVSAQMDGLMPLTQHAMNVTYDLAYHDYEGLAFDTAEQERLVADLGTRNHMILSNHGTLAVGTSCAETFLRMYFLERSCAMQIRALSGDRIKQPPKGTAEMVEKQIMAIRNAQNLDAAHEHVNLSFAALKRKLDRLDDSYKS